jgi:hypothetical protein
MIRFRRFRFCNTAVNCTSATGKSNLLILIRYPFLTVTTLLQLLVAAILIVTMSLLVNAKVTRYRSRTVTPLLWIICGNPMSKSISISGVHFQVRCLWHCPVSMSVSVLVVVSMNPPPCSRYCTIIYIHLVLNNLKYWGSKYYCIFTKFGTQIDIIFSYHMLLEFRKSFLVVDINVVEPCHFDTIPVQILTWYFPLYSSGSGTSSGTSSSTSSSSSSWENCKKTPRFKFFSLRLY